MTTGKICTRTVDLATADEPVRSAAERMLERNVGSLVVVGDDEIPTGMITDRDLALRVVATGKTTDTPVGEVMTTELRTVTENTPIEDTLSAMRNAAVRRMLVVRDDGKLAGIVTVDDILALLSEEFRSLGELLTSGPQEHVIPVHGI